MFPDALTGTGPDCIGEEAVLGLDAKEEVLVACFEWSGFLVECPGTADCKEVLLPD